jgi:predicted amidophosphoribosyltransferase
MTKPRPLIRCPSCRYSLESSPNEPPKVCPQCRGPLTEQTAEAADAHEFEKHPTQKMKTIPKPED